MQNQELINITQNDETGIFKGLENLVINALCSKLKQYDQNGKLVEGSAARKYRGKEAVSIEDLR